MQIINLVNILFFFLNASIAVMEVESTSKLGCLVTSGCISQFPPHELPKRIRNTIGRNESLKSLHALRAENHAAPSKSGSRLFAMLPCISRSVSLRLLSSRTPEETHGKFTSFTNQ